MFQIGSRNVDVVQRQQPPELLRVPLESVVLTVKSTFGDGLAADDVLCRALTPPSQDSVTSAVNNLKVAPDNPPIAIMTSSFGVTQENRLLVEWRGK